MLLEFDAESEYIIYKIHWHDRLEQYIRDPYPISLVVRIYKIIRLLNYTCIALHLVLDAQLHMSLSKFPAKISFWYAIDGCILIIYSFLKPYCSLYTDVIFLNISCILLLSKHNLEAIIAELFV